MTFQTESFRKIFEAILAAHQTTLPPSFGILGVYLICLYEHLERLGGTYNVRQAFDDVYEAHEPIFVPEFLAGASASHQ